MENLVYGERSNRFWAYVIDIIPIMVLVVIAYIFLFDFGTTFSNYLDQNGDLSARINFLKQRNQIRDISLLLWIIYGALMDASKWQGTAGKRIMRIKVTDLQGHPLKSAQSFGRNFSKIISVIPLGIGFIWILFDKKRRGWHDIISKTVVLSNES